MTGRSQSWTLRSPLFFGLWPTSLADLTPIRIGSFVALPPPKQKDALATLAGRVVSELDPFRAPPYQAKLARRRTSGLTPAQEVNLVKWGYPYVFDQFKFHMTLSGNLKANQQDAVQQKAQSVFTPLTPSPFVINALSLVGVRMDGQFELIKRSTLGNPSNPT
jgi:hypothetical protein